MQSPPNPLQERCFSFVGGNVGPWRIEWIQPVVGESLLLAERVDVRTGYLEELPPAARWLLRGVVSHARYTTRDETAQLAAIQPALGRPEATCAALIPVTKNAAWWAMSQDERREIFAAGSIHTTGAMHYLPAVARRLHHGRDLGEPFDFLTWFEYAPADAAAFEELVAALRRTQEWRYVCREVDVRLRQA